jgi:hypothetical protein
MLKLFVCRVNTVYCVVDPELQEAEERRKALRNGRRLPVSSKRPVKSGEIQYADFFWCKIEAQLGILLTLIAYCLRRNRSTTMKLLAAAGVHVWTRAAMNYLSIRAHFYGFETVQSTKKVAEDLFLPHSYWPRVSTDDAEGRLAMKYIGAAICQASGWKEGKDTKRRHLHVEWL